MKKSIIAAGAASAVLAAMPVMGAFAATSAVTDNINLTLSPTCSISRTNAVNVDATTTWTAGTETYATVIAAGITKEIGTSTFSIVCNDTHNGHKLDLAVTGLTGTNSEGTIAYRNSEVVTTASGWNITVGANATLGITAGLVSTTEGAANLYGGTAKNTTSVTGQTFTATYNVGTVDTQAAGTYTGAATYTLTYGA